jgi:hypothetical protein
VPRGPRLDEVEVRLDQRGEPGDEVQLDSMRELRGFEADRAKHDVHPLVSGKTLLSFSIVTIPVG